MTSWADAHARAAVMAAEVSADLNIPTDQPVDVFAAIERLRLVLAFAPLGKASGYYLPGTPGHPAGILINEVHPRTRQRYTAGHELGHHLYEHSGETESDPEGALMRGDVELWSESEKEAEAFGAWFLMPRRLIRRGLESLGIATVANPYHVYALSLWLGTSYTATARQLAATRVVDRSRSEKWSLIPPRSLKVSLAGKFIPDDLRNDVWLLDGRHNGDPIEARPGDRVVLMLEETPSTGYSWKQVDSSHPIRVVADSYVEDWEPAGVAETLPAARDLDGGEHPRCFVIEVAAEATAGLHSIVWEKGREWTPGPPVDEFALQIRVNPSLHGVQLAERELALA
jgi:hypothetical protein